MQEDGGNRVYVFSEYSRLLSLRNAYDIGWTFYYEDAGRLSRLVHDVSQRSLDFSWNTELDPVGVATEYDGACRAATGRKESTFM